MFKKWFLPSIILLNYIFLKQVSSQEDLCGGRKSCSSCMQELDCVWCIQPNFNTSQHCRNISETSAIWCPNGLLRNLLGSEKILEDEPLSNQIDNLIQIKPQRWKLVLRKNQKQTIKFKYVQAKDYPVDLYYIMDLSASMLPHKDVLAGLGEKLANAMRNITKDFRIGFGSFVDKIALPFVSTEKSHLQKPCEKKLPNNEIYKCAPPYSFINHMSLAGDYKKFTREVKEARVSGNLDSPEGGFDALVQAMVCEEIGWRPKARRIIVFSSDAEFHVAGDGKLAGVVEPNDGKCHMVNGSYTAFLQYDYPSVSQINYLAKKNNFNLVFAIVNKNYKVMKESYRSLAQSGLNSNMGFLDVKSSNVVNLVINNYKKIVDLVRISSNATDAVGVQITSNCTHKIENGCKNIHVGEVVEFTATIEPLNCSAKGLNKHYIALTPGTLNESLIIELEVLCNCDCQSEGPYFQPASSKCTSIGNLECGVCNCPPGRIGPQCQCQTGLNQTLDTNNCRKTPSSPICSERGDCFCGECTCRPRPNPEEKLQGRFCECSNYGCPKSSGKLCSGRGVCDCDSCICNFGWTGESCDCQVSNATCVPPYGDQVPCSGNGECNCGKCSCKISENGDQYSGEWCDECRSCPARRCAELRDCVECQVHKSGPFLSNCSSCPFITEVLPKEFQREFLEEVQECTTTEETGCTMVFWYLYRDTSLIVQAKNEKKCVEPPDFLPWILGVVALIVLIGLITLIVWKIATTIHDRQEYQRFEEQMNKLKWARGENPLYKEASSTFANPSYNK